MFHSSATAPPGHTVLNVTTHSTTIPAGLSVADTIVDLLVVGSGTGMTAALAAHELGLSVLIVEKSSYVGGSTARSGGALWLPASPVLREAGADDTTERAAAYLDSVVAGSAPRQRSAAFLTHLSPTVELLRRSTPLRLFWARDYSDYHPEEPGGSAAGRTCECRPLDTSILGEYRTRLRPGVMESNIPIPTTGADYRWMNLVARVPGKGIPTFGKRLTQGVGGRLLGRRYAAGGQGLMAGLFAGVLRAGIPVWTDTTLLRLAGDGDRISGAVVDHDGREVTITARRGVVLATGGFDHSMDMRWKFQSESLGANLSLGAESNTGDGIRTAQELGADIDLMDQAWWFPAVAPLPGKAPAVMLAERSLPGCLIVNQNGHRFANESTDYMSFGQRLLELERSGSPVEAMWIIFDQQYRNSYVFGAELFPRMRIPQAWYDAGIAVRADSLAELGAKIGVPVSEFTPDDDPIQRKRLCRRGSRLRPGSQRLRPVLRRPDDNAKPQPASVGQRPVLRRENGAERSGDLRRAEGRRAGTGAPRGRRGDRRAVRNRQYRRQCVRHDVPGCWRDDRAGTGVRLHRGPGCGRLVVPGH